MDTASTPPDIPSRGGRQHRTRPERLEIRNPRVSDFNQRMSIPPASPEVISSLITSLSTISASTSLHFENNSPGVSLPVSPVPSRTTHRSAERHTPKQPQGSFGVDYGAFAHSSQQEYEEDSLDNLAAPPPSIRTSKPPSGYSVITALKSPARDTKFLKSRPSSIGSSVSRDHEDLISIGDLSVEPGKRTSTHDLKRRSSVESWEKKQARNSKGLKYMSSKEQLREKDVRRRASAGTSPQPVDRLSLPAFDTDSFMSTVITEEDGPVDSYPNALLNPIIAPASPRKTPASPSTINGRFIPSRDSSLRNKNSTSSKKRTSHRSSRQGNEEEYGEKTIAEIDEHQEQKREHNNGEGRSRSRAEYTNLLKEQDFPEPCEMPSFIKSSSLASKQVAEAANVNEQLLIIDEQGAPSPAVAQRRASRSEKRSSSRTNYTNGTPEPTEPPVPKRNSTRLKRLSVPTSPSNKEQRKHASPEPVRPMVQVDERPSSADSIDDAVDAYLRSPRLSQKIRHPQTGRTISFSEVGDSEGFAVFCCVGMGLTRYITAFYDELALTLKLRLITPDRPGVGESEPYADGTATPLSWPDDVYAICQTLKITKFSILAHSAGAIYALATALRMPQHIRGRIHLLAPWIPPSQMNTFGAQNASPPSNSMPTSQRILRALPTPILKAANSSFMSATSSSITSSLPRNQKRSKRKSVLPSKDMPAMGRDSIALGVGKENRPRDSLLFPNPLDRNTPSQLSRSIDTGGGNGNHDLEDENSEAAILAVAAQTLSSKERQANYDTRLTHAIWDLATTNANPAVDLLVCLERRHTIGFRYVDITRAVVIHHGSRDSRVPVENVKWLGKTMRRCEVRVLEGEGHGLMASAGVMGGVLMEMSREWEDWMRVVNKKEGDKVNMGAGVGSEGRGRERSGTGVGGARDWGI